MHLLAESLLHKCCTDIVVGQNATMTHSRGAVLMMAKAGAGLKKASMKAVIRKIVALSTQGPLVVAMVTHEAVLGN